VPEPILDYSATQDLELDTHPSLEAQIAALADDIAYNAHDIDDGYRASCFSFTALAGVPIAGRLLAEVDVAYPELEDTRRLYELNRRLITAMVDDAIAETHTRLARLKPGSAGAIRQAGSATAAFSESMLRELAGLRAFLFASVYRHPRVMRIMGEAEDLVVELFQRYARDPDALPPEWREEARAHNDRAYARHVADFIAGQTDRYALAEHRRLFDATSDMR
jgi:dGTPase